MPDTLAKNLSEEVDKALDDAYDLILASETTRLMRRLIERGKERMIDSIVKEATIRRT